MKKEETPFTIPGRGVTTKSIEFCISEKGIDYFEGPSRFRKLPNAPGINVNNVQNVVVIGDRNLVRASFEAHYRELDLLEQALSLTDRISDEEKVDYGAEIETIKAQLAKSSPDKGIIHKAWTVLSGLSKIPALFELVERVRKLIEPLIG